MKNSCIKFFLSFLIFTLSYAQNEKDRFQEFKKMKMNFIIENTSLTEAEKKAFLDIFEGFEDRYHNEVWIQERQLRKGIIKAFDTISSSSASHYISDFYNNEKLGMSIKYERNQKLLTKINPKSVLNILHQERRFDREMFNQLRNRAKKDK